MRRLTVLAASAAVLLVSVGSAVPATQGRWVMRDLGTLGREYGQAWEINVRGQVICNSWDGGNAPLDYPDAFRSRRRAFLWENGKVTDLGTLGGKESEAHDVNDRGQVVGWSYPKKGAHHAFLWQDGKMRDLGTLGGEESEASDLNDRGQVVGHAETAKKENSDQIEHAFLWQDGRMRDLGTLGGEESGASDINNRGQIVGWSDTKKGDRHAFLWQDGRMRDLGTLGGGDTLGAPASWPSDINERGQVVGRSYPKQGDRAHAFLWEKGKMTDLGTLGGKESEANDINDRGQVVGEAEAKGEYSPSHAFLWQNGTMRDLGGHDAWRINEKSQVIGYSGDVVFHWQKGKTMLLPTPRRRDSGPSGINEKGQVIGYTDDVDCYLTCPRAVLWTYKP
jgi:probable HAF family extracellular repeat protein